MVLKPDGHFNGKGTREAFRTWLAEGIEDLYSLSETQDAPAIKQKLQNLVPEYTPQDTESVLYPPQKFFTDFRSVQFSVI